MRLSIAWFSAWNSIKSYLFPLCLVIASIVVFLSFKSAMHQLWRLWSSLAFLILCRIFPKIKLSFINNGWVQTLQIFENLSYLLLNISYMTENFFQHFDVYLEVFAPHRTKHLKKEGSNWKVHWWKSLVGRFSVHSQNS